MIDFPASPIAGQLFTSGSQQWIWDGVKWVPNGSITTVVVPIGDNRIINGNFAINQRGYVSGAALGASGYGHDRWRATAGGGSYTFTVTLPDTTITLTSGTLTQIIEGGMIEGGVYILSWVGTATARVYQGTASGSFVASPLVTSSLIAGTNVNVEFNPGTLTRVKLEIGNIATPFNRQSLAQSLVDCQRYFQWIPYNMRMYSPITSSPWLGQIVQFAVPMRIAPTIGTIASDPNAGTPGFTTNVFNGFLNITPYGAQAALQAPAVVGDCYVVGYRAAANAEL